MAKHSKTDKAAAQSRRQRLARIKRQQSDLARAAARLEKEDKAATKAARAARGAGRSATAKETKARKAARQRSDRARAKERTKEYKRDLAELRRVGAYQPKAAKLTRYRKKRINEGIREFENLIRPDKYFFIPFPKTKTAEKLKRKAREGNFITTRKGIFYEKGGHDVALLKYNPYRKDYYVSVRGHVKAGPSKGRFYEYITPIAAVDDLANEEDNLRAMAAPLLPLKETRNYYERLTFRIYDDQSGPDGTGTKQVGWQDIGQLIEYLKGYRKNVAAQVELFRHIVIMKTKIARPVPRQPRPRSRPRPSKKASRASIAKARRLVRERIGDDEDGEE